MPASVVGRDVELALISDFLAKIPQGAQALVLEGDAGMGKTTLWRDSVERAAAEGLLVLRAQPAQSETALSFSGLGDLLDPVLSRAFEPLPSAQRAALSRALLLDDLEGPPPDPHAVGVAVLNVLRTLSNDRPVLVSIDDVQWLDAASSAAIAYSGRRLGPERIGLLLARRSKAESSLVDDVRRGAIGEGMVDLAVGPLSMTDLGQVVQERVGPALPRPLLAEVHQTSGGNPFFALEIVRALVRGGVSVEAGKPLPLPESLHEVVHDRLLALPHESQVFLAAAAAHAHPTIAITEAASGVPVGRGLGPGLDAQIVEVDRERIRFTHPLLAVGAYEVADPARRRDIHARLAELLVDPEARAWQLAASVDEPDEAVAAALEHAADHARRRGGLRPAALLLDRSRDLTPADQSEAALRRGVESAYLHFEAGDAPRAEAQLQGLLAPLDPGLHRARALWVLARIRTYEAPGEAAELFLSVVGEAHGDTELLAAAHEGVSSSLYYALERLEESAHHAEVALTLARELGDRALEGDVLISKLGVQTLLGDPAARITANEAQALQVEAVGRRILDHPVLAVGEYSFLTDAHQDARDTFLALLAQANESGDESARPYLYCFLSQAELALGDLAGALESASEGRVAAEQSGESLFAGYNRGVEALAEAQLGNAARARDTARCSLAEARSGYELLVAASALGHVELAVGRPAAAVTSLEPALALARREKIAEPSAVPFAVDLIEALIELGRSGEATAILDWYEGNAQRLERVSALANGARGRGLLAAQVGDLDAALAAFGEALDWHAKVEIPLDRGRTLLALGATQRRMKRRREARATLEEALAVFERIGAALWAERARSELKRISGRAASPGALTPAEARVAALVAEGKTNKQVAAALFLSDRTVEGHLAHIFGKLGIRHRGEVAGALQTRGIVSSNTGDSPVSAENAAP